MNDIAVGIAMMSFGTGLAFFFGKPFIQPQAPRLNSIPLGDWTGNPALAQALQVNPLFFVGIALAVFMWWAFKNTKWGLIVRMTGDSAGVGQGDGGVGRPRALPRYRRGRVSCRHRRGVPVALLSGQLEPGPLVRGRA